MTDDQSINIDSRKLFNLGVNLLLPVLFARNQRMRKNYLKT
jgi:hypothetical protein